MKKVLSLVMSFAVALSVSADGIKIEGFTCDDVIESPFFNDYDVSIPNESRQHQLDLQDLTGEIVFEYGGEETNIMDLNLEKTVSYEYLYISYSGDEDVDYTIMVNDSNLLSDENLQYCVSWDETNNRYIVQLRSLIRKFPDNDYYYSAHLYFTVTVHSPGYSDLTKSTYTIAAFVNLDGLNLTTMATDLSYYIKVTFGASVHYCNLNGVYPLQDGTSWYEPVYVLPRLDHDYDITVTYGQKSAMGTVFSYKEETVLIPARECDIFISRFDEYKPELTYLIIDNDNQKYYCANENELGGNFAIFESNFDYDAYELESTITIDNQLVWSFIPSNYAAHAVNLLTHGNIFGGEYQVGFTVTDGYNSLSADTVLEIHPVLTRLTPESVILECAEDMNNLILRIDGQEVEPSDGHFYVLERLDHEYSITVQAGVKMIKEWGDSYSGWSQETVITIPARLLGDVDGDGMVNIGDVTALIDYLLGGDDSEIYLDNADVESDDKINIGDVTALIDLLLGGN